MKIFPVISCLILSIVCQPSALLAADWIPLFNGKDLKDWTPKFAGHAAGEDPQRIFRVEDGLLKVSYDQVGRFDGSFGHLFYKTSYSHYRIRAVFRFTGDQVPGGPDWAYRNNGLMLHCEAPKLMAVDKNFPDSIECQFWGNDPAKGEKFATRHMGNVYTPGTKVMMDGVLVENANSQSPLFSGLDWVTVEVEVRGAEEVVHFVNGQEVLRYRKLQLDDGTPLGSGYIAIQAETHPIEFRDISIRLLKP